MAKLSTFTKLIAAALVSQSVLAATPASTPEQLGNELTPIGAPKAAQGDIPAWDGGLTTAPAGHKLGANLPDPFADEKPLFVITAETAEQYQEKLSEGQLAMFKRYPDSYRIPVYPTHRTAAYPQAVYDATKTNATNARLTEGGNGVENMVEGGVPFPFPENGLEAIWNHIVRYRGGSLVRTSVQVTPQSDGTYTPVRFRDEYTFRQNLEGLDPTKDKNVLFYFKQDILSPARLAGNVLLVHETLDQVEEPRRAWVYNAGQRRVRRAPQVSYDGPGTASDGMRTTDNFDMFNGAPDRYDWKLVGKQEMYIPYNSYNINSSEHSYDDVVKAGHVNQDLARYELHRVWKVEATLKEGKRHIYAKRTFYIDEDTWQIAAVDHFDGRGELWRVAEAHNMMFYDYVVPYFAFEALYDLNSGRYLVLGLTNEEENAYDFGVKRSHKQYTPSALRRSGRR